MHINLLRHTVIMASIAELIRKGEGKTIEFKRSLAEFREIVETK